MPSLTAPLLDFLVKRGTDSQSFDLSQHFAGEGLTYTVTSSNGTVLDASIDGAVLRLNYHDALDYSDLVITATDSSGHSVSESTRVRVTGENAFTIAVLPDTQNYSDVAGAPTMVKMAQWLVDHKDSLGIEFVTHVGDITNSNQQFQWDNISQGLHILDGEIPYALTAGNHDQGPGGGAQAHETGYMDQYFSPEAQAANSDTFGGTYDMAPERAPNNFHTFTAPDGTEWLVLSLEFGASDDVIRWGKDVIEAHLDHRVILTTHAYMNWAGRHDATGRPLYGEGTGYDYGMGSAPENANDGETMYRELVQPYSNVTMTFSGHIFGDGAETLVSYDAFGNPVHQMLVNYQNGVSTEINDGNGGSGAIRLLTIDPANGQVYTSTYFAEEERYLSNDRGDVLDRDDLAGPYRGQEETLHMDLGTPDLHAIAKAGNDIYLDVEGTGATVVTLQGAALNPGHDDGLSYVWRDADGNIVAEGATPELTLEAGRHSLTLTVTDSTGAQSHDSVLVVVGNDETLLVDNFNDGDAAGWSSFVAVDAVELKHGTTEEFGIVGLPGAPTPATAQQPEAVVAPVAPLLDGDQAVDAVLVAAASPAQSLLLKPGLAAQGSLRSYSIAFDLMVPSATAAGYMGLIQSNLSNGDDADMFLRKIGSGVGIGTLGDYAGTMSMDAWHRVVITYEHIGEAVTITKYVDGASVGSQTLSGDVARYALDTVNGVALFADNDGETAPVAVSGVMVTDAVMSPQQVAALGGTSAGGIAVPEGAEGTAFVADAAGLNAVSGAGSLAAQGGLVVAPTTDVDLGVAIGDETPEEPEVPEVPELPDTPDAGVSAGVTFLPALSKSQSMHVTVDNPFPEGSVISSYTLVYDILLPGQTGGWTSLFQADTTNKSDGELFINSAGGIGISGDYEGYVSPNEWHRIAFAIERVNGASFISKYIDGVLVGTTTTDAGRFDVDLSKGLMLFTDETDETRDLYISSVLFTDKVMDAQEIGALGGVTAGGIVAEKPSDLSFQLDFSGDTIVDDFDGVSVSVGSADAGDGNFVVKGSYADRVDGVEVSTDAEGRVYESSNTPGNALIYSGEGAQHWQNYRYEVTLHSTDDDTIGAVFYFKDDQNTYRVTFNASENTRQLLRIKDGVETVLATAHAGMAWSRDVALEIAVSDGEIRVFLDGQSVFGTVVDSDPLSGGTVGFFSDFQTSSQFDDVYVGALGLRAHAGADVEVLDVDGDGKVSVTLDATDSYGGAAITGVRWLSADGTVLSSEATAEIVLSATGPQKLTLELTDAEGHVARDTVGVDAVSAERILFRDDFSDAGFGDRWSIVDEGERNGVGEGGALGDWQVIDGALVQLSDVDSRELTWSSADAADDWDKGWSPLGDGTHVLRRGTTAILSAPEAKSWTDYAVEATIETPDTGALGLMVHYQDAGNYYKVELDAQSGTSLFQLIEVKDGVEKFLTQIPARYSQNTAFQLRVEVVGNAIQASIDGVALFAYAIESRATTSGTVGLFSWGSAGLSFDDVRVVSLAGQAAPVSNASPDAVDDGAYVVGAGEVLALAAGVLLANDTDPDGDALSILSVTSGTGGIATLNEDGSVRFQAEAGYVGSGHFTYVVSDGRGGMDQARVDVMVTPEGGLHTGTATGGALFGDADLASLIIGGVGQDRAFGGRGDDHVETGQGDDMASGGWGDDVILGGAGDDQLFGGLGNDSLDGGEGSDMLLGGAGDDMLSGGAGSDMLFGGAGADRLDGGAGDDWLTGGEGGDTFVFTQAGGNDVVLDFEHGSDVIDLSAFTDLQSFADLSAAMSEIDGGVVLHLDAGTSVTLSGLTHAGLDADDFRFA
jgi:Ca2+-binding RTX toxin-like protein